MQPLKRSPPARTAVHSNRSVGRLGPFPAQRLVAVEVAGEAKQGLGKVAVNPPVASLVGVGDGEA